MAEQTSSKKAKTESVYMGTNEVPRTADGKTIHVDVGPGEVANRVITVGAPERAAALASHFDGADGLDPAGRNIPGIFHHVSSRGFTTYTGNFQGVRMSVISIGMGMAMMDFLVREVRAVVEGPMLFTRFGTCGGLQDELKEGTVIVASDGALCVTRNPDAFGEDAKGEEAYRFSKVVPADSELSQLIFKSLVEMLPETGAVEGMNATADSFYSSQGRIHKQFDDRQDGMIDKLTKQHPTLASMEMESFALLDLARVSYGTIRATATAILVANRVTGNIIDAATLKHVESMGGKAVMSAMASCSI